MTQLTALVINSGDLCKAVQTAPTALRRLSLHGVTMNVPWMVSVFPLLTQLTSLTVEASHIRVSNLDPEIIEHMNNLRCDS